MIHELRRYTIKPGKTTEYVEKAASIGRTVRGDRYGKLLGYWSTELGPLNQVVHLWEYADLAARATARAGLAKDERWVKEYLPVSGPLLEAQENLILAPFDWAPFRPTSGMGIHELRVYRLHPGKVAAYGEAMREALPLREKHSVAGGLLAGRDRAAQHRRAPLGVQGPGAPGRGAEGARGRRGLADGRRPARAAPPGAGVDDPGAGKPLALQVAAMNPRPVARPPSRARDQAP